MRVVLQRVTSAVVTVDDVVVGEIGRGLVALVGIGHGDDAAAVDVVARKTALLRVFDGADPPASVNVADIGGAVLVVSQFTLMADTRRGNRPSWSAAASPAVAEPLVDRFADRLREHGVTVATGRFGAHMDVALVNDGPVTIVLDHPA